MTLIDKAEALLPCPFCTEGKTVSTYFDHEQGDKWGYASCDACGARGPEVRTNYDRADNAPWRAEAIAAWNRRALPARGVGVPADVRDYAIEVSEAYDTMMEVQRNPAGAWQVIQALAGHIAALAPTDAAQAREAALEWVKKHGIHGEDCDTVTRQDDFDLGFDMETICTCGLTAILRAMDAKGGDA